jgi:hypothetical protein
LSRLLEQARSRPAIDTPTPRISARPEPQRGCIPSGGEIGGKIPERPILTQRIEQRIVRTTRPNTTGAV